MKRNVLFMMIAFLAISFTACKKEKEEVKDVLKVRVTNYNPHEDDYTNHYLGDPEEGPTEVSAEKGSTIYFSIIVNTPKDDEGVDIPLKKVNLKIVTDGGLTVQRDIFLEGLAEYHNGIFSFSFPGETSFTAYFTALGTDGKTYENDVPLKVNITASNKVIKSDIPIVDAQTNAPGSWYFLAPYCARQSGQNYFSVVSDMFTNSATFTIELPRNSFSTIGYAKKGGLHYLISADEFASENLLSDFLAKFPEIGFDGAEMEIISDYPKIVYDDNSGSEGSEWDLFIAEKNLDKIETLDALTFSNPTKKLAIEDGQFFKFRTIYGNKGIGHFYIDPIRQDTRIAFFIQR